MQNKRRIIRYGLLPVILILLIVGMIFLGNRYSEEIITDIVSLQSEGKYRVAFDKLHFKPLHESITVKKLKLLPDTLQFDHSDHGAYYNVQIEEVQFDLESIWDLYFKKELRIENIKIVDPIIQVVEVATTSEEKQAFSRQTGNLHTAIMDHLKTLRIDQFRLERGSLQHFPSMFEVDGVQFFVKNFMMDTIYEDVFFSQSVELEVTDERYYLPDSIHQITFDLFRLSTKDSLLTIQNIRLHQRPDAPEHLVRERELTHYDIAIPELRLRGIDYLEAYHNNHLRIKELMMRNAQIFIEDHAKKIRVKKDEGNSLTTLILQKFKTVEIDSIDLTNSSMDISENSRGLQQLSARKMDLLIGKFLLDSSNNEFGLHKKYFESLNIEIDGYEYLLPDSIHHIHIGHFNLNTRDSIINLKEVKITPDKNQAHPDQSLLTIGIPSITIDGIDFKESILQNHLKLGAIVVQNPSFKVDGTKESGKKKDQSQNITLPKVYESIRPFFNRTDIDNIQLNGGSLKIGPTVNLGDLSFNITGIHLSDTSTQWHGAFNEVNTNIQDIYWGSGASSIYGKELELVFGSETVGLNNWKINYSENGQQVSGTFDTLSIHGIKVKDLIKGNLDGLDSIYIVRPEFEVNLQMSNGQKSDSTMADVYISMVNGKLSGSVNEAGFRVHNLTTAFQLGNNKQLFALASDSLEISPNAATFIKTGDVSFDETNILLGNVQVNHKSGNEDSLSLAIPGVFVFGWDQEAYWQQKIWKVDSLVMDHGNVDISFDPSPKEKKEKGKRPALMAGSLHLRETAIQLNLKGKNEILEGVRIESMDVALEAFNLADKSVIDSLSLLFSDRTSVKLKGIQPRLTKGDTLNIGQVTFRSDGKKLDIQNLFFESAMKEQQFVLPQVSLSGIDLYHYVSKKTIKVDSFKLTQPYAKINIIKGKDTVSAPPRKYLVQELSMDHFAITEGGALLIDAATEQQFEWKGGTLIVTGVSIADTLWINQFTNHVQTIEFSGKEGKVNLGDGYAISANKYYFNLPEESIVFQEVKLKNQLSRESYNDQLNFQKDWFDVEVNSIKLDKVDIYKLLNNNELCIDNLSIDQLDAHIYRDLNHPFPEGQLGKMPQQMLMGVKLPLYLDKLSVWGNITYEEMQDNKEVARMTFNDVEAYILDITTMDSMVDHPMKLHASGKMLNVAPFIVDVSFDMLSEEYPFQLSGRVGSFQLDAMNELLIPVAQVNIKDGINNEVTFTFDADQELARGVMDFRYRKLKVQVLNPETLNTQGFDQGIKTFFANAFVLKTKNPSFIWPREGVIFVRRDTSRSIFNYWGKALLSGSVSSIGIHKSDRNERQYDKEQKKED